MYLSVETKTVLLEDILAILSDHNFLLPALGDLQRMFEKAGKTLRASFFAAKKIYFYNVWINDELDNDSELVETITVSMKALISGYIDRQRAAEKPSPEELSSLRIPS